MHYLVFGEWLQPETRDFRLAIDPDSQPECAQSAVGVDVEFAVTIESGVVLLADAQDGINHRAIKRKPYHAAMGVAA